MKDQIKVIFFDIDGTLADNRIQTKRMIERVPESAKKTLKLLKKNNITPVIATGRGPGVIQELIKDLGIDSYVAANGLRLVYQGKTIYDQFLSQDQIKRSLEAVFDIPDVTIFLETSKGNLCYKDEFRKEFCDKLLPFEPPFAEDVYQVIVVGEGLRERVRIEVEGLKAKMVAPVAINIFPEEVSKASGIEQLLSILNLNKSNAMAFGDEENDIEMFSAVGCSVAMGNGVPKLKEVADYVTDRVELDGIYKACKHYKLIDE